VLSNLSSSAVAQVSEGSVTIADNDDPAPVAVDDEYDATEDEVLSIAAPGLLSNDTNAVSVIAADDTSTLGATITFNADGSFTYDPTGVALIQALAAGATEEDTFVYNVTDLEGHTASATVRITLTGVNDAPLVGDDDYSGIPVQVGDEFEIIGIDPANMLLNDSDLDGGTVTVASVAATSQFGAAVQIRVGDGFVEYNPRGAAAIEALSKDQELLDTFEYTVSDGQGGMTTGTVMLKVIGLNDDPVAGDDAFATPANEVLQITFTELTNNDTEIDQQDVLTIASAAATSLAGAVITLNGDGSISYDPTGVAAFQALSFGQTATDTFTYTISDGQGGTDTATVTITVSATNHAPVGVDDVATATANVLLEVPAAGVLTNDTDADVGDTLAAVAATITSVRGAAVMINADGSYSYDGRGAVELSALPAGAIVEDSFTYTVRDLAGAQATATVRVTVTGVNDPPIPGLVTVDAGEDAILPGTAGALLATSSDPDTGDTVTAVLVAALTTPMGATMSILENGSYFYDPTTSPQIQALQAGETLEDTFAFSIKDAAGLLATATITFNLQGANDAPVATDDTADAFEDQLLAVSLVNSVLNNDNDADTTDTRIAVQGTFTSTRGATVTMHEDGSYDYDPTLALTLRTLKDGETIDDTFQYTIRDAAGAEDVGTVTVTVTGLAADTTAPTFTTSAPTIVEGNAGQVAMEFTVTLDFASLQTITMNYATADATATAGVDYTAANGTLTFTPGTLTQTFTVQIIGDTLAEGDETFSINITDAVNTTSATGSSLGTIDDDDNQAPTAVADTGATTEDAVLTVTNPLLIANDTDPDNHVPLTAVAATVTSTQGAAVTINADGSYSYDPTAAAALQALAAGATIDDTFTYQVRDNLGATSSGTVTITVTGVNDAPTAGDDTYAANEDAVLTVDAPGILANDDDPDTADTLTILAPTTSTSGAVVTVNQDGSFTYDPRNVAALQALATGDTVEDEFTYTVEDGHGGTVNATVTITVTGVNDAPVAAADDDVVDEDVLLTVPAATGLLANDTDVDTGTTLTIEAATLTSTLGAAVTINADGSYTYDPRSSTTLRTLGIGQTADDTFTYKLLDGDGGEATGTVTITVTGTTVDGLPKITIADITADEGDSGDTIVTFTVTLGFASLQAVAVNFATANASATAGEDYVAANDTVTFAVGATTQTFQVIVNGDAKHENDEAFLVILSNAVAGDIDDNQAVATITNDDPIPTVSIAHAAANEGDSGTTNLTFTVSLSNPSESEVTVNYSTSNAAAESGVDYVAKSGTVTFAPGENSKTIDIVVNGDTIVEPNELFLVLLASPSGATLGNAVAEGQITNDDGATISIGDATIVEGNAGEVDLVFIVTLSQALSADATVDFATVAGTALAGTDFTAQTGTVTILAGQTTAQITVKVLGDLLDELDENLTVTLSNPSTGVTIQDNSGAGTITDNDEAPTISVADVMVVEGNTGTTNLLFTFTLSAASGQTVTVNYATANGTATSGTDFTAATGTVTFAPGETSQTVTVQVTGDTTPETDETLLLNLTGAANATTPDNQAQGTIDDDDTVTPTLSINDVSVNETNTGTVEMTFTVTLSAAQSQDVTVNFATSNGTAIAPGDYATQTGTLTFTAGQTQRTITIIIASDVRDEDDETLTVTLSSPSTGITLADATGTGTINDDDAAPLVAIADPPAAATEGNSGTVDLVFTVTLSAASDRTITVPFSLAGVNATLGSDFQDQTGTLTFEPGVTSMNITVKVIGDTIDEPTETFTVSLGAPTNASLTDGVATGTINDDDPAASGPTLSIGDKSIVEGNTGTQNLVFTVTLSQASTQPVTVNFATANGAATAGTDYTTTNGTLTFAAGETTKTISVPIAGDTAVEPHETFTVTLSNPSTGVSLDKNVAIGTITNDDGAVNMSITDATVNEGNTGTTTATFTVTLSAAAAQNVTVNFATAAGTAIAGTDFVANTGMLTFQPGETSKTITVTINGDTLDEANESFSVVLTGVSSNATLQDDTGAGSITDDDAPPTISIADQFVAEGNTGTKTLTFTVTLSAASGLPVTVNYATTGGTATSGTDFVAANGQVTIPAGQTSMTFTVTINGDTTVESNETFTVTLTNPTNATFADATATGTITDDDSAVTISIGDATVTEGDSGTTTVSFTVTLSGPSGNPVTVNFATADGTATQPGDYTSATGTLTFAPGETSKTITVTIAGDSLDEANETFTVNLTSPSGATLADGTATGTITDNDTAGTVQFSNPIFTVNENGGSVTITVTRTGGTAANATVNYTTSNGSASAGSDYTTASGTLTFLAGETSKTFTIPILNDAALEGVESINLTLSSPTGGVTLGAQSTAAVNISDDDGDANQRFVNNLYEDLLGRAAESQGLGFYVDLIQSGRSRGDVSFMIQHSPEYRNKLVSDLYQELLGRAVDAAGLDVHTQLLARGKSIDDVRASILGSDEFFTRRGGGTNEGFVNALYQAVLNRTADATGREIYVGVLSSGGSRSFVASEVLKSIEADRRLSATYYTKYLGRAADNAGNEFQSSALNRGTYEPRVLAGITASDEYFAKL